MCIFPEGTRNRNADDPASLLPFKDGSFKIAQKTGCPIIPMVLTGTDDVFEKHFPWIHGTNVTLTYGEPILLSELSREEQKHIASYCENIVQEMLQKQIKNRRMRFSHPMRRFSIILFKFEMLQVRLIASLPFLSDFEKPHQDS